MIISLTIEFSRFGGSRRRKMIVSQSSNKHREKEVSPTNPRTTSVGMDTLDGLYSLIYSLTLPHSSFLNLIVLIIFECVCVYLMCTYRLETISPTNTWWTLSPW